MTYVSFFTYDSSKRSDLIMKQVKWFARSFDFSSDQNIFPSIIERLEGTPIRLERKITSIPASILNIKPGDKWSIQENMGHLIDLEPLWQGRLADILNGQEMLRETDLQNTKTHEAEHNTKEVRALVDEFEFLRGKTIELLSTLEEKDVFKHALHPRLKTPMRTMDLFLFVAEHDDHHLAEISRLTRALT